MAKGKKTHQGLKLYGLPFLCALIPLLSTHVSWLVSIYCNRISPCFPYWSDCVSISKASRQLPVLPFFKGIMIISAVLAVIMWVSVEKWFIHYGIVNRSVKLIKTMGILAGLFLILYLAALGVHGDQYRMLRRTGVIVCFSFTFFPELLMLRVVLQHHHLLKLRPSILTVQKIFCWIMLIIGIGNTVLDMMCSGYDNWQNAAEWWFVLCLYGYFFTIAAAFKQTGFSTPTLKKSKQP